MSRVRFMSPYLKGGRDAAKLSNRARYIATRPVWRRSGRAQ